MCQENAKIQNKKMQSYRKKNMKIRSKQIEMQNNKMQYYQKKIQKMKSGKIQNYKQRNGIAMTTTSHKNANSFKSGQIFFPAYHVN